MTATEYIYKKEDFLYYVGLWLDSYAHYCNCIDELGNVYLATTQVGKKIYEDFFINKITFSNEKYSFIEKLLGKKYSPKKLAAIVLSVLLDRTENEVKQVSSDKRSDEEAWNLLNNAVCGGATPVTVSATNEKIPQYVLDCYDDYKKIFDITSGMEYAVLP